ncbi:hypothetical protein M3Y94_00202200 [Aphelenchoides besseyi]|nr:hypothetical protein M3Y94_00202200 [Aphelenchoides besseyi]
MQTLNQVPIPFYQDIVNNGIPRNGEIELHGDVVQGQDQAITFELRGLDGCVLHINIRMGLNNDHCTIFNSYEHRHWGHENRYHIPVHPGSQLNMKVVNHWSNWEFPHRISANRITRLEIRGDVRVHSLHFRHLESHVRLPTQFQPYQPSFNPLPYQPAGITEMGQQVAHVATPNQGFGQGLYPNPNIGSYGQPTPNQGQNDPRGYY